MSAPGKPPGCMALMHLARPECAGWPTPYGTELIAAGFLGQLGVAPFRARRLVMRVMAAQVIRVSEC